jgi:uncharacterized protein
MNDQDVRFDSGGCTLAGTFQEAPEPIASALLITGSGRSDRNSDARLPLGQILRVDVTRAVAEALATAQVSTFRYDKRGVGASEGDYLSLGMSERFDDARAALGWLAARTPGLAILVVGCSEGTYYAARLAAEGGVAGIVLLSGSALPGGEVVAWQVEQLAPTLPRSAKLILRLLRTDAVRSQRKNLGRITSSSADVIRIQGVKTNARWIRDFVAYDPAPVLKQVTVPVLAITGGHDLQVPPGDVEVMGRLVGGPFEGHVVGDLSHLLRPDPRSVGPRGYRRSVRQPVSPEVLGLVTAWVARTWGRS